MAVITPQFSAPIGTVTILNNGKPVDLPVNATRAFWDYIANQLFLRVGGNIAPTNAELANMINNSGAGFLMDGGNDSGGDAPMVIGYAAPATTINNVIVGSMLWGDPEQGEQGIPGAPAPNVGKTYTDVSSSRALATTYTNSQATSLLVIATFKCLLSGAAGNAYVLGKSDTASPPTTVITGNVGIEGGLSGQSNSSTICFLVSPGNNYRIEATTATGTVTLGKWFEAIL